MLRLIFGEPRKISIDMEGRVYSDFYRNTSEEIFMKTLMESSVGITAPTMEMLGFKNLSNNFRADSEELFKSWLNTGEVSFMCLLSIYKVHIYNMLPSLLSTNYTNLVARIKVIIRQA